MIEEIDKKILYSLDEDSAKSLTKISQETEISPQLVKYHLERMEKEGIILAYWPMIDFRKLGYFNVSYFLKLKNLTKEKENEIIRYLKNINNFNIVMRGDGYWDLHITISARNIFQAVEVFNGFYEAFHEQVLVYETAISVGFYQFRRDYLGSGARRIRCQLALTGSDVTEVKLNFAKRRIIESMNRNCRKSFSQIAKEAHLSRDAAVYNVNKIKKEDIIQSYAVLIDQEKIGYPRYRVLIGLANTTSERFNSFFLFCQNHPNIISFLKLFGNWQALIDVEISTREDMRVLLRDIMSSYGDIVLRIENTHVYSIDKFRDVPFKLES